MTNLFDSSRQYNAPTLLDTAPLTIEEIEHNSRIAKAEKMIASGMRPPSIGQKLYITTSRGIANRRRAGIAFNMTSPVPVEVVSGEESEIAKRVKAGEAVCSQLGYFDLIADDGLVCHSQPLDAATLEALQGQASEAKRLADENEQLQKRLMEASANASANAKALSDAAELSKNAESQAKADAKRIADLEAQLAAKAETEAKTTKKG